MRRSQQREQLERLKALCAEAAQKIRLYVLLVESPGFEIRQFELEDARHELVALAERAEAAIAEVTGGTA